jgi:cytochrome c-type biogenesis protein CcmH/NrfG
MSETMQTPAISSRGMRWTRERTALLGLVCLVAGTAGGWSIRGLGTPTKSVVPVAAAINPEAAPVVQQPGPEPLKEMADAQAAPLLEKLKSDPANADVLTSLGNVYYDARQYPVAVDYYARVLRVKPADAAVRTDMGTAFWFMGNADKALAEFEKALTFVPDNPSTLFNLGLVKWKGKMDAAGATAAWERLLATDPNYEQKTQVEQMLAEVKTHLGKTAK